MRKIIILAILMLTVILGYQIVVEGVNVGSLSIPNYEEVETSSKKIDTLIKQLININDKEYPTKKQELESAIKTYKNKKEEYEELEGILQQNTEVDISLVDIYDVDFLWTIIGNYGTEEGISLKFDVAKSPTSTVSSDEYTMCDLKFTISGDYIALTDFIYDLEDDSRLGFEISNFAMQNGAENLQATFIVKEVPINNQNLTELTTSVETTNTSTSTTSTKTVSN